MHTFCSVLFSVLSLVAFYSYFVKEGTKTHSKITKLLLLVISLILICGFLYPLALNWFAEFYSFGQESNSQGDLLSYGAGVLSLIGTLVLGLLVYWQSEKQSSENDKVQKKLMDINEDLLNLEKMKMIPKMRVKIIDSQNESFVLKSAIKLNVCVTNESAYPLELKHPMAYLKRSNGEMFMLKYTEIELKQIYVNQNLFFWYYFISQELQNEMNVQSDDSTNSLIEIHLEVNYPNNTTKYKIISCHDILASNKGYINHIEELSGETVECN